MVKKARPLSGSGDQIVARLVGISDKTGWVAVWFVGNVAVATLAWFLVGLFVK
jgi:hypothetical protein